MSLSWSHTKSVNNRARYRACITCYLLAAITIWLWRFSPPISQERTNKAKLGRFSCLKRVYIQHSRSVLGLDCDNLDVDEPISQAKHFLWCTQTEMSHFIVDTHPWFSTVSYIYILWPIPNGNSINQMTTFSTGILQIQQQQTYHCILQTGFEKAECRQTLSLPSEV